MSVHVMCWRKVSTTRSGSSPFATVRCRRNARQLVAHRAVQQHRSYGRVDPAGQRANHSARARPPARTLAPIGQRNSSAVQIAAHPATLEQEVAEEFLSRSGVHDFGMELDTDDPVAVPHRRRGELSLVLPAPETRPATRRPRSPWLIHTGTAGTPFPEDPSPRSFRCTVA